MLHMEQWYMYTQRPQWNTSDFAFAARHLSHRRVLREIFRLNSFALRGEAFGEGSAHVAEGSSAGGFAGFG